MTETVPTLLMNGNEIVDVMYTEWQETAPGEWDLAPGTSDVVVVDRDVNRVVYESPIGCFESDVFVSAGFDIRFVNDGRPNSHNVRRCQRSTSATAVEAVTVEQPQ